MGSHQKCTTCPCIISAPGPFPAPASTSSKGAQKYQRSLLTHELLPNEDVQVAWSSLAQPSIRQEILTCILHAGKWSREALKGAAGLCKEKGAWGLLAIFKNYGKKITWGWIKTRSFFFFNIWQITSCKRSGMGHIKCYISIKLKPSLSLISWKHFGTTYTIKGKLETRIEMVHFEKCQNKIFECFLRVISLLLPNLITAKKAHKFITRFTLMEFTFFTKKKGLLEK